MARVAAVAALCCAAPLTQATGVEPLLAEALRNNPEIAAARAEGDAARERIAPASALDDPMLEAGVINAPLPFSLRREDMTMKMLGITQKLPYPGKRALRQAVAAADAAGIAHAVDETVERVLRDVRVSYEELRSIATARRLAGETLESLRQLAALAESRYAVGGSSQVDVLQAQGRIVRLQQELLALDEAQQLRRIELRQLLGRRDEEVAIEPAAPALLEMPAATSIAAAAAGQRPRLLALEAMIDKGDSSVALARREYYPDFELRLSYGQRDRMPSGMPRDDMVTMSVAVNLPLWRKSRLAPRVAEATALRRQAGSLLEAQQLATRAELDRQLAGEQRQRASAQLYRTTLVPQVQAAFDSAVAAYRSGTADLATVLEARMQVYDSRRGEAEAIAAHNKAIAEIDLLTGRLSASSTGAGEQP